MKPFYWVRVAYPSPQGDRYYQPSFATKKSMEEFKAAVAKCGYPVQAFSVNHLMKPGEAFKEFAGLVKAANPDAA